MAQTAAAKACCLFAMHLTCSLLRLSFRLNPGSSLATHQLHVHSFAPYWQHAERPTRSSRQWYAKVDIPCLTGKLCVLLRLQVLLAAAVYTNYYTDVARNLVHYQVQLCISTRYSVSAVYGSHVSLFVL